MKDVARMAGVSTAVVSMVINNKPGVSDLRRKRVLEVIEKTNYQPNANSRRLVMQKSFNIVAVIKKDSTPFGNLFYFEIAEGVLEKSREYGYNVTFVYLDDSDCSSALSKVFDKGDADGAIFFDDIDFSFISELILRDVPYVIVDAHPETIEKSCICADYELAAYTGTKHLIENNHKLIGFICKCDATSKTFYTQVFTGFKNALDESALSTPLALIQFGSDNDEDIYNCTDKLLNYKTIPTAIMCGSDMIAVRVINRLKEKGYHIPNDISIVGIDDIMIANYIDPKLTTIRIDKAVMGMNAMELLINTIQNRSSDSIIVPSDNLIIRKSVKKLTL